MTSSLLFGDGTIILTEMILNDCGPVAFHGVLLNHLALHRYLEGLDRGDKVLADNQLLEITPDMTLVGSRLCPICTDQGIRCECSLARRIRAWGVDQPGAGDWAAFRDMIIAGNRYQQITISGSLTRGDGTVHCIRNEEIEFFPERPGSRKELESVLLSDLRQSGCLVNSPSLLPTSVSIDAVVGPNPEKPRSGSRSPSSDSNESKRKRSLYCEQCSLSFAQSSSLFRHMRHVHEGQKNYACQVCGRKFSTASNMQRHEASIHSTIGRETAASLQRRESMEKMPGG
mmetsp:Transcript_6138/g.12017  ORF Transcript_6138/g.12017 Transcript_6138/m.12017 type:complete len:286 (+) Transcript_6138:432-1289(+)